MKDFFSAEKKTIKDFEKIIYELSCYCFEFRIVDDPPLVSYFALKHMDFSNSNDPFIIVDEDKHKFMKKCELFLKGIQWGKEL